LGKYWQYVHKQHRRFNLRKLSELEVRKQHYIKISKRFADLKNLIDSKDKHVVWKNIKGKYKNLSYGETISV